MCWSLLFKVGYFKGYPNFIYMILKRKLRGEPPEVPVTARPCVGLCYLMRMRGEEMETTTRKSAEINKNE